MSYEKFAFVFQMNTWKDKCKDILQTLNVRKIPAKEHQGAYR